MIYIVYYGAFVLNWICGRTLVQNKEDNKILVKMLLAVLLSAFLVITVFIESKEIDILMDCNLLLFCIFEAPFIFTLMNTARVVYDLIRRKRVKNNGEVGN